MRAQHRHNLGADSGLLMRGAKGFTLLELLIVIAIIGILSGLGVLTLRDAIQAARLNEGSAQLAADLQRARSGSQRFNRASTFTLTGSPATSYTVTINGQAVTRTLPEGIRITTTADARSIIYNAPFGEISSGVAGMILKVNLAGHGETREVRVLGTTGKVYSRKDHTP